MLRVGGKTVLEHAFDALPDSVTEVILVVGYLKEKIEEMCKDSFAGRSIKYVVQTELNGTGGALTQAKPFLHGSFLVIHGDDMYLKSDLQKLIEHEWSVLVVPVNELGSAGKVEVDDTDKVLNVLEKESHTGGPGLANTGAYMLDTRFFDYPLVKRPESTEYGLPQTIVQAVGKIQIQAIRAGRLIRLTDPSDIIVAERILQGLA
jgi:NDP-sugar pyrophosphorylase family protein